jgi:hypothetical protein
MRVLTGVLNIGGDLDDMFYLIGCHGGLRRLLGFLFGIFNTFIDDSLRDQKSAGSAILRKCGNDVLVCAFEQLQVELVLVEIQQGATGSY